MQVELNLVGGGAVSFERFAERHGLTIKVTERPMWAWNLRHMQNNDSRFYANFDRCETKNGPFLRSEYGDGPTPEFAVAAYKNNLCGKLLVIDAMKPTRREIQCPNEWSE